MRCSSSLYILTINPLSAIWFGNIFPILSIVSSYYWWFPLWCGCFLVWCSPTFVFCCLWFRCNYLSLALRASLTQRSSLSEVNRATPAFFLHSLGFNLYVSLYLKWVSYRQSLVESFFLPNLTMSAFYLTCSGYLHLSVMFRFQSLLLFVFCLSHLFFVCLSSFFPPSFELSTFFMITFILSVGFLYITLFLFFQWLLLGLECKVFIFTLHSLPSGNIIPLHTQSVRIQQWYTFIPPFLLGLGAFVVITFTSVCYFCFKHWIFLKIFFKIREKGYIYYHFWDGIVFLLSNGLPLTFLVVWVCGW